MTIHESHIIFYFDASKHIESKACLSIIHAHENSCKSWLNCLSDEERLIYHGYRYDKRKNSYLLGRYCAKQAIAQLIGINSLSSFSICSGIFRQPIVRNVPLSGVMISLSHSENSAAAIAHLDSYPCGIDLEKIAPQHIESIYPMMTNKECELLSPLNLNKIEGLILLWCAKESLTKVLKTGLSLPFSILEIYSIEKKEAYYEVSYKNFPQYSSINFISQGMMLSMVKPKKTKMYEFQ